jgi:hypothetical protein
MGRETLINVLDKALSGLVIAIHAPPGEGHRAQVQDINAGSGLNPFKNPLTRTAPPVRVRGVINHAETVLSEFVQREIKVRRQSEQPGQERLVG